MVLTELLHGSKDVEDIAPILTRYHELCHYMQLTSTPFGFAMWQAEVAMLDLLFDFEDGYTESQLDAHQNAIQTIYRFTKAIQGREALTMEGFVDLANRASTAIARHWGLPQGVEIRESEA